MLPTSHTAHTVASLFMEIVRKIHGLPCSLVSDRDPLFVSKFWQELFRYSGTQLRMSSAYHSQSDGQMEVMNRVIEQYLRAFVHGKPKTWGKLLLWVEWSHNISLNAATGSTPYEIIFRRQPFNFPDYLMRSSKLDAVEDMLTNRDETFRVIRKKLLKAQATMKKVADTKRRDEEYQPRDWVLVKLRPRQQFSAKESLEIRGKLTKRFFGPFKVVERIGPVAYHLQLPEKARIHPVFHCSLRKRFQGNPDSPNLSEVVQLPSQFIQNQPLISPLAILSYRKASSTGSWEVLVQWEGLSPDETSWEDWNILQQEYHLEDKVILQGLPDDSLTDTGEIMTSKDQDTVATTTRVPLAATHQANIGVQTVSKTKRRIVRLAYLKDFV